MENNPTEEEPTSLSDEDFALLLEDRAFVDYFNVFNSLPIFGQHVIYNFIEKEFEYEPPVRKRNRQIDRREVVRWLISERYPLFEESGLFNEFVLCSKLRDIDFNPETYQLIDTPEEQLITRYMFGRNVLGCCLGMQLFREFLRGTTGENVYRGWMDIEKWRQLRENDEQKQRMSNHIKSMYIKDGSTSNPATKGKQISFHGVLNFQLAPEREIENELLTVNAEGDTVYNTGSEEVYIQLQRVFLTSMRRYWVPRYLIHLLFYLPKHILVILKRECPGDIGFLTKQKNRRFIATFPREYSAKTSTTSTNNVVSADATSASTSCHSTPTMVTTPRESSKETESDVSIPELEMLKEKQETNITADDKEEEKNDNVEANIQPEDLLSLWGGKTIGKETTVLQNRTDSDTRGVQLQESWQKSSDSSYSSEPETDSNHHLMIPLPVLSYVRGRRRITIGRFPVTGNEIVCALASEHLASSPFRKFLQKNDFNLEVQYLNFWTDVRHYLDTDDSYIDFYGNTMKKTLAKKITQRYLGSFSTEGEIFSEGLKMTLFCCLTTEDDISLLCSAQDIVTETLKEPYKNYVTEEKKLFRKEVCRKRKLNRNVPELPPRTSTKDGADQLFFFNNNRSPEGSCSQSVTNLSEWSQTFDVDNLCLTDEQIWRAFEILILCVEYGRSGVCPNSSSVIYDLIDVLYSDYGSLHIRRSPVVRQDFLRSLYHKPKVDIHNIRVSKTVMLDRSGMEKENRARFMNRLVIRRNGMLIERPFKPRTFTEVLKNPLHYEFFKRFMMANKVICPLRFWSAVEEMKEIQNPRARQNMVWQIFRRFFSKSAKQGQHLDCSDDIIRQIPTMGKVPGSIMICAQSSVFRSMERKWYQKYLETFPTDAELLESMKDHVSTTAKQVSISPAQKPRRFKKRKTIQHWQFFIKAVMNFIRAMKEPAEMCLFEIYLKCEAEKESVAGSEKSILPSRALASLKARMMPRNKIVAVEKLASDLLFWSEVEKYKQQVDNLHRLGNISQSDNDLLHFKAKAIIACYLASEVPPRIQINVPYDLAVSADNDLHMFGPQRGLFHDACMHLFPLLYFYWKRFHEEWLKNATPKEVLSEIEGKVRPRKPLTPHQDEEIPSYLHLRYSDCDISQQLPACKDDDHFCIRFSLMSGMKLIFPLPKEQQEQTDASQTRGSKKTAKAKRTSVFKDGKRDSGESKLKELNLMSGDNSTKGTTYAKHKHTLTPQQEKAKYLSQLVEELNKQNTKRPTNKFKSFNEVVMAVMSEL